MKSPPFAPQNRIAPTKFLGLLPNSVGHDHLARLTLACNKSYVTHCLVIALKTTPLSNAEFFFFLRRGLVTFDEMLECMSKEKKDTKEELLEPKCRTLLCF